MSERNCAPRGGGDAPPSSGRAVLALAVAQTARQRGDALTRAAADAALGTCCALCVASALPGLRRPMSQAPVLGLDGDSRGHQGRDALA